MRASAALLVCLATSGCYFAVRGGPSLAGRMEYDVTGGIEFSLAQSGATNPLAGRAGVTVGAGVVGSAVGPTAQGVAGVGVAEGSVIIGRTVWTGSEDDPSSGSVVRVVGAVGAGSGTIESDAMTADASVFTDSIGAEMGAHWGGGTIDSFGIFLGAGVRRASFSSTAFGDTTSIAPYASLRLEGGAVFQTVLVLLELAGR